MKVTSYGNRASWLAARRESNGTKHVGASDASAAVGKSRRKTPLMLFAEIARGISFEDGDLCEAAELGLALQKPIAAYWCGKQGLELFDLGEYSIVEWDDWSVLTASLDYLVRNASGEVGVLEIKHLDVSRAHEFAGGATPIEYEIQVRQQMLVTGATFGILVPVIGGTRVSPRMFRRDDELVNKTTETVNGIRSFWKHVENDSPPSELFDAELDLLAVKKLHPNAVPGQTATLNEEVMSVVEQLEELRTARLASERREKMLEAMVRAAMGDAEIGLLPDQRIVTAKTTNVAAQVRALTPEMIAAGEIVVAKAYSYRKLNVVRPKVMA